MKIYGVGGEGGGMSGDIETRRYLKFDWIALINKCVRRCDSVLTNINITLGRGLIQR